MAKNKTNSPRQARSLSVTLATAFFTLSAVVLLVNGAGALYNNVLTGQEALSSKQQLTAQNAASTVSNFIEDKFTVLITTVKLVDTASATPDKQNQILQGLLGLQPAFRQLVLLNTNNNEVANATRISETASGNIVNRIADLVQIRKGQRFISPVYFDDVTSEPFVTIAIPVTNALGDFQGILIAELNLKFMWNLVDQLKVGNTGYAYVVDDQGNLIAFHDTSRVLKGENEKQIFEVNEYINNPNQPVDTTAGVSSYTGLLGKTVSGTYVPLNTPNWAVITELPNDEAYQPVVQGAVTSLSIILIMALLAGLAGIFLARRLAVPLVNLTETATRIAGGETELQATVAGAQEIASLATAFNIMTTQLRESIISLDQRVADRTKALAASVEVSRRLSTILDQRQLVIEVVDQVQAAFGYYHVHIYFVDQKSGDLVMAGGTGEAGRVMLANGHKVLRGKGLVGQCAETNTTVLVADVSTNPDWLPNPLLPDTKSEAAVPIAVGEHVLGVLDVQDNLTEGLKQEDLDLLQSIANQVAIALQNARTYAEVQAEAAREALIGSIGEKIRGTSSVEDALQVAVREVGRTLNSSTSVKLAQPGRRLETDEHNHE